ncbi:MAG: DUF6291 domain-containing protein [Odoribacter splanchnicus]
MEKQCKTNQKEAFLFYRTFFESIETLSKRSKLLAYEAIMKYAFYQEMPENLPPRILAIFIIAKPLLDASHRNYLKRIKGKKRKDMSDFEKELEAKVQLPERVNESSPDDSFAEEDNNDSSFE